MAQEVLFVRAINASYAWALRVAKRAKVPCKLYERPCRPCFVEARRRIGAELRILLSSCHVEAGAEVLSRCEPICSTCLYRHYMALCNLRAPFYFRTRARNEDGPASWRQDLAEEERAKKKKLSLCVAVGVNPRF